MTMGYKLDEDGDILFDDTAGDEVLLYVSSGGNLHFSGPCLWSITKDRAGWLAGVLLHYQKTGEVGVPPAPEEAHADPADDCDRLARLQAECDRLKAENQQLRADPAAVMAAEVKASFSPERQPTTNERHLLNLLSWREKESNELRKSLEYANIVIDASAADAHARQVECDRLKGERDHLQRFKEWVHAWLDSNGVPTDPDPEHTKQHGCRISGRLRYLIQRGVNDCDKLIEQLRLAKDRIAQQDRELAKERRVGNELAAELHDRMMAERRQKDALAEELRILQQARVHDHTIARQREDVISRIAKEKDEATALAERLDLSLQATVQAWQEMRRLKGEAEAEMHRAIDDAQELAARYVELSRRAEALEEALRPFAKVGAYCQSHHYEADSVFWRPTPDLTLLISDFYKAKEVLKP